VLSGGADVDPARYGEPADPRTVSDPDRDGWELAVLDAALRRGLPVLAICRGMQLLNVACGGSLHQHLPDVVGAAEHLPSPETFGCTAVRIEPSSRLAAITGGRAVRCHHHQAVRRLGDGLVAAAWARDGTIEAIEHTGHDFVLGVQWHPEEDAADARLFQALVRAASRDGRQPAAPCGPTTRDGQQAGGSCGSTTRDGR
jgi:gamma-glutamyl-gamma-aminobutyrate hydrolase PuuD